MGGCAREVQERRIRDRSAARGNAAAGDRGCDAGLDRGEGLCRGLAAPQRTRSDRLAEALGHDKDALDAYKFAANTSDRPAAAEGKLLEVLLRKKRGEIGQAELLR